MAHSLLLRYRSLLAACVVALGLSLAAPICSAQAADSLLGGLLGGLSGSVKIGNTNIGLQNGQIGIGVDSRSSGGDASVGNNLPGCGNTDNCLIVPATNEYNLPVVETSLRRAVQTWVNFFLGFLALIAMVMLIYSGFRYVTSGVSDQAEDAKKGIVYAVIGIVVIFFAYAIVNTLIVYGPRGSDLAPISSNILAN